METMVAEMVKELEAQTKEWTKGLQKSAPTKISQMPNLKHSMELVAW